LSPTPCADERWLFDSEEYEAIFTAFDNHNYEQAGSILERGAQHVVVCGNCGRFYLSKGKDSNEYYGFLPEKS
jgi:hypothetical protein